MAKSILFNNNYIDSTGIVHNKTKLSDILSFSTNERINGNWDDGKPLYKKTIIDTSGTIPSEIDISSLNADYVYVDKMIIDYIATNNSRYIRHEFNLNGSEYFLSFIRNNTIQIRSTITNVKSITSIRIIVKFTKNI